MSLLRKIKRSTSTLENVLVLLRAHIQQTTAAGSKLPAISELAHQLGVSANTVGSALAILKTEGLVDVRHGSGTYIRDRTEPTKHVALLSEVDLLHSVTSYFHREMFCQLRSLLLEAGHAVRYYVGTTVQGTVGVPYSDLAAGQLMTELERVSAIGAFIMLRDEPWVAPAKSRGIPIISNIPALGPAVNDDRNDLMRRAVVALAGAGCRRVGYLGWDPPSCEYAPVHQPGLHEQMAQLAREHGFVTRQEWMSYAHHPSTTGAGWEEFCDVWRGTQEKPDGLVITDDQLLPGVFEALANVGVRVPEQLQLATHFTAGWSLPLPCPVIKIEYSPVDHARAMADLILGALRGEPAPAEPVLLPYRVVLPLASEEAVKTEATGTPHSAT